MRRDPQPHVADDPPALARATRGPFLQAIADSALVFDDAQLVAVEALGSAVGQGAYLWGDVGRGKTLLSEIYFRSIPTRHKRRFHFHEFFVALQAQVSRRREPLDRSLRRLLGSARAVLFDEFHVHDVADGVYLTATLDRLLGDDVLLLATSNYAPENLMPNPLFHERFRPAIELIRSKLDVVHVGDGADYRAGRTAAAASGFSTGAWCTQPRTTGVVINIPVAGHTVRARQLDDGSIAFTFGDLCAQPLGVAQYLALAEAYDVITLAGVPDLATVDREPLARFAHLVEVLYDQDVPLFVSAEGESARLLAAAEPPRDARRIVSRLALLRRAEGSRGRDPQPPAQTTAISAR